ncbi:MAG: MATE family efflux transporter [Anaeroplasmataceae bacterium]|nr:MATE family efflux transporter [Anaeroplasmataceae bacterium]
MEQTNAYLGEEKLSKLLFKFSIPCIVSLLISALYNIVDQIFIGNSELGYLGNAATGVVFPILMVAMAFSWCIGDGSAAYLSLCQGRKDAKSAHQCVGTGIMVTLAISLLLILCFMTTKDPLLRFFGASDQSIDMAIAYFTIVVPFFPIFMLINMLSSIIRADGSPAFSMIAMASGAIVNIILDPIFIFGCHFGIAGAAWATVIGQVVSFGFLLFYLFKTKTFHLSKISFIPNFKVFKYALSLGISTLITQLSIVVISVLCNVMLKKYGELSIYGPDIPISVISIETKVFTIIVNLVVGIVLGGQPIIGYNYGAGKKDRVKKTYLLMLFSSLIIGLVATLLIELFPEGIIRMFGSTKDPLYLEFAKKFFRIFLSLVTCSCIIKLTSIFFQAVGQTIKATIISLIRDIICFIPLIVCLPLVLGIDGILYAGPIADAIGIIVTFILTLMFFKQYKKQEEYLY